MFERLKKLFLKDEFKQSNTHSKPYKPEFNAFYFRFEGSRLVVCEKFYLAAGEKPYPKNINESRSRERVKKIEALEKAGEELRRNPAYREYLNELRAYQALRDRMFHMTPQEWSEFRYRSGEWERSALNPESRSYKIVHEKPPYTDWKRYKEERGLDPRKVFYI